MDAVVTTDVPDIEFEPGVVERRAHLFLLLLVPAEDADFGDVGRKETLQDMLPE